MKQRKRDGEWKINIKKEQKKKEKILKRKKIINKKHVGEREKETKNKERKSEILGRKKMTKNFTNKGRKLEILKKLTGKNDTKKRKSRYDANIYIYIYIYILKLLGNRF